MRGVPFNDPKAETVSGAVLSVVGVAWWLTGGPVDFAVFIFFFGALMFVRGLIALVKRSR